MLNSIRVSCEYPKVIVNRRYSKLPPELRYKFSTYPDYYLEVPCGRCSLCKSRISNEWKVRLIYEMNGTREHRHKGQMLPRVAFLTFTIADQYYADSDDIFASELVKFRDSFRKRFGRSPRYWAITDRGSQFGRLHLHMLLFDPRYYDKKIGEYTKDVSLSSLKKYHYWWKLGFVDAQWVNKRGVTDYVSGYLTGSNLYKEEPIKHGKPICKKALEYKPRIFPSKGLGIFAINEEFVRYVQRRDYTTLDLYGYVYALPRYYFQKVTDYIADELGLLRPYITPTGKKRDINYYRDEIVFHRQAVNKAEVDDYLYRNSFDVSSLRYHYKRRDISRSLLLSSLSQTFRFVTPEKERYRGNDVLCSFVDTVNFSFEFAPPPEYDGYHYTYYACRDWHYAKEYELNEIPF